MINKTNKSIIIFFTFAFGFFLSNLLRSITATLTPVLTNDFDLSAGNLGLLAGGYFIGFSIMQIPLGFLLDKHGPKKIISSFLLIAVVGTISFALAKNFSGLLISRIFIGVGVSACMMGPLTGYRVWFAEKYQQRANSWMLMFANLGFVFSTLPVQILLPIIGWRWIFVLISILILLSIILIILFIPSWDQNKENKQSKNEMKFSEIWTNKFFISLIPLGFFNYGGVMAIQTLWAGPWMLNVTGYNALQSATGLLGINVTMLLAYFIWGYILPKISKIGLNTMRLIKFGLPISYISLLIIILLGKSAGAVYFTIYILTSIVISLTQPAIALSFPRNLAGKSLTSFNVLLFSGTFFMQWGIGLVIDYCKYLGFEQIKSYQISFSVFLIICIFSYLYFIMKNLNEKK
jgi:MFS family permease|tara:strand:- start:238 stop:1452 length:1215 start_codon:yes stop_codon:yes gene_type:complete